MIKGNRINRSLWEADALLAKVNAKKDARRDGDEARGTEPHFHDSCGGGSLRREEEAWTDHTSDTLYQIKRELMALKAKGGKDGKSDHRLNEC